MKSAITIFLIGMFLFPLGAGAAYLCSSEGYTIVFINGIFTDLESAKVSKNKLEKKFNDISSRGDVTIQLAHNQTNLGGVGDLIHSVAQSVTIPINIVDRDDMLRSIQQNVSTQKILLVGHSQGTFYTNEIYDCV